MRQKKMWNALELKNDYFILDQIGFKQVESIKNRFMFGVRCRACFRNPQIVVLKTPVFLPPSCPKMLIGTGSPS